MKLTNTAPRIAVALAALAAIGAGAGVTAIASAANAPDSATREDHRGMGPRGPHGHGVHGTVSEVNGSTLTITDSDGTSYTVDASQAKVSKVVSLPVQDIKVGDEVGVMGQVSGTSITAQHIMDGIPPGQGPPGDTDN